MNTNQIGSRLAWPLPAEDRISANKIILDSNQSFGLNQQISDTESFFKPKKDNPVEMQAEKICSYEENVL